MAELVFYATFTVTCRASIWSLFHFLQALDSIEKAYEVAEGLGNKASSLIHIFSVLIMGCLSNLRLIAVNLIIQKSF